MEFHNEENLMTPIVMQAVEEDETAIRMEEQRQITSSHSKGKDKVMSNYSFNNDGLFSPAAIKFMDGRILKPYSKEFGKVIIDMDAMAERGGSVKDVLESAVLGSLDSLAAPVRAAHGNQGPLRIFDPVDDAEDKVVIPPARNPSITGLTNDPNTDLMEAEEVLLEMALYESLEMQRNESLEMQRRV